MFRRQRRCRTVPAFLVGLSVQAVLVATVASPALGERDEKFAPAAEQESSESARPEAEPFRYADAQAGYRFVTPDGTAASAMPYTRLKSGIAGGAAAGTIGSNLKLSVDTAFLNEDDYHAELSLDHGGAYRLHLESQALWHNLPTEQLPPASPGTFSSKDLSPDAAYGVRSAITQADGRIRFGNYPYHLSLGYWELNRTGTEQLRFSDHSFGDPQSTILSTAKRIDRITREGTVDIDGRFGQLGLAYGFRIRDFSDEAPVTRYDYQNTANGALTPGSQAHDVTSGSRVLTQTIKLYTDLSGGLVGSAVYMMSRRENDADRGDAHPASRPADTLHNVAGDLSYTPMKELSFALTYRRLQVERESPATVTYPYSQIPASGVLPGVYTATPGVLLVRPSTETTRDTLSLSGSYRPSAQASLRLEYRAELESRDSIPDPRAPGTPSALHGDSRQTHTGKAGLYWRPYNGVKINASYSYAVCNNPAYAASFSDRHSGQLFVTYASGGTWGATASYLGRHESGENAASTDTIPVVRVPLPRKSRSDSANASLWFSPLEGLTVTGSYSFLRSDIDQAVLFAGFSAGSRAATNYRSTSHVFGLDAIYAFSETLDLSLVFQQLRSSSHFNVQDITYSDPANGTPYSTGGISGLTALETTETGVSARADWRISHRLGSSLEYAFRLFDSGNPLYDGSVHTTIIMLKARW